MEHGLILLIEAILAVDRKLQKPLRRVVPDLARLRTDPGGYLAVEEVIIGPRRSYAVATVLGIMVGIVVLVGFAMAAHENPKRKIAPGEAIASGVAVLVTVAATIVLVLHWLRGGSVVVRREGVALLYRGRTVFCPWALFQTAGSPYQPDHRRVILPVNEWSPVALGEGEAAVDARPVTDVKTRQFHGGDGQAALADLYEVKVSELGELLLHLGRLLGDDPIAGRHLASRSPATLAPLAVEDKDDWLRIRLTRLPFPPICTACGARTGESVSLPLSQTPVVAIDVPLCRVCQEARQRRRLRAVLIGIGIGFLPSIVWLLATGPFLQGIDVCLGFGVLLPIGFVLGLVAGLIGRDRSEPVRFREYSASAGTVAMWIRPSPGRLAFRAALGFSPKRSTTAEQQ